MALQEYILSYFDERFLVCLTLVCDNMNIVFYGTKTYVIEWGIE